MEADDAALRAYYERGMERERLSGGRGDLEFSRTAEIVLRRLPTAPAVVADIGGGPGRYARWLASRAMDEMKPGYQYVLGWWNPGFTTLGPAPGARIAVRAVPVLHKSGSSPP